MTRLIAAFALLLCVSGIARAQERVVIGYVSVAGDARYEPITAYGRMVMKQRGRPITGAEVGIDEAEAVGRVLNVTFGLEPIEVPSPSDIPTAVRQAQERGVRFVIVDAPAAAFKPLAEAVRGRDVLLFNVSAPEDALRRELCAREIVHTAPTLAMLSDGLAQYLVSRKWRDVLILQGPADEDAAIATAFERALKKFGGRVVARQAFKPGTDPRERERNNPALLTAVSRDYDVAFVADAAFDFARSVPYQMSRPRPVVGAIGLEPLAWHWTWEHNGAPQVNSRFEQRSGGRHMEGADWAAWMAVKMVVQATLRARSTEFAKQRDYILRQGSFDGNKGVAVSVRPWDHQLRQAVMLATPYAVTATAPLEGFMHQVNDLDTLGDDAADSPCRLDR